MTTWLDGITTITEIAFTTDPLGAFVWTDVSPQVRHVPRVFHGSMSEDGDISPSTMAVVLANRDRRFDPDYAAGPYYGNLLPMKPIRHRLVFGAFVATLFTGYVQGWPQRWERRFDGTVQVQAIGGDRILKNLKLPVSAYSAEVMDDDAINYWPFQSGALTNRVQGGAPMLPDSSFDDDPVVTVGAMGGPVGEDGGIYLPGQTGGLGTGSVGVSTIPAALDFWVYFPPAVTMNQWSIYAGTSTTNSWLLNGVDNNGFSVNYSNVANNRSVAFSAVNMSLNGLNHIAVYLSGTNVVVMLNGSIFQTIALGVGTNASGAATVALVPSGANTQTATISHLATYNTAPSETRFNAHWQVGKWGWTGAHGIYGFELGGARINRMLDDVGWPATRRDIDIGGTSHGPYLPANRNVADGMHEVERAECGLVFIDMDGDVAFRDRQHFWTRADTGTVFADNAGSGEVKIADLVPDGNTVETIRNIGITRYAAGEATIIDTVSKGLYGPGEQDDDCPTIVDRETALNRSRYIVRDGKDPKTRITRLVCHMRVAGWVTTQVTKVLALKLGTVVTVRYAPGGVGAPTTKKVMVRGFEYAESERGQITVTLYLAAPPISAADAPYFTPGHATRGKPGAAAGNKIPY